MVTDGPFAETREQLGGYFLVEAADLDEAIGLAARIPGAKLGTIEVRPLVQAAATATDLGLDELAQLFDAIREAPFFTPVMSLVEQAVAAGEQLSTAVEDGTVVHPE